MMGGYAYGSQHSAMYIDWYGDNVSRMTHAVHFKASEACLMVFVAQHRNDQFRSEADKAR